MDRVGKGLTPLPYKALRQLLRISYVSIFVAPPKLLDGCATLTANIIFALCEDQLLYPYRKHWGKKTTKSLGLIQENFKKKKQLKWISIRGKLSREVPSLLSLTSAIVLG